jgi:3'-phosphoadenosine 5'-phosphosulfate sulfotransferase (PAPS reductase)/FAD synthetase
MTNVFNFSGGKTSAYMVIHYWKPGDLVIFTDTGREHPKTYKFIHDFEAHENIPVIKISYKNSATPFDTLLADQKHKIIPNRVKRMCTVQLKMKTCKRYLRSIGVTEFNNFIGFRADEPLRIKRRVQKFKRVHDKFPLYYDGITKPMINEYWANKPYNLEIPSILGNCTLCFMKGKNAIINILASYPELAAPWISDEEKVGKTYLTDISIKQLLSIAQNNLFKDKDLNEVTPAFDCACTT